MHQRYRKDQEDQLGALGLVLNVLVHWNTIYMDAALDQLKNENFPVNTEDEVRLSPFAKSHFNMLGKYSFTVPDEVKVGKLRPLRDPDNP